MEREDSGEGFFGSMKRAVGLNDSVDDIDEDDEIEEEEEDEEFTPPPPPPPPLAEVSGHLSGGEENLEKQRVISTFTSTYNDMLFPRQSTVLDGDIPTARKLDDTLTHDLQAIFVAHDVDQDGNLNRLQLVAAIEAMGIRPNDKVVGWFMARRSSKKTKLIDMEVRPFDLRYLRYG